MDQGASGEDLLATMEGLGRIEVAGDAPVQVGYTIMLVVPGADAPSPPGGGPVLTRVAIRARLADLFHWYTEHRADATLVLEDGRRLALVIMSPDGDAIGQHALA